VGGAYREVPGQDLQWTDSVRWDEFRDGSGNYFSVYRLDIGMQTVYSDGVWTLSLDPTSGTIVAKSHGHCTDKTNQNCRAGDGRLDLTGELVLKSGATYVFDFGNKKTENAPDDIFLRIFAKTRIKHHGS
jgi:hypothetical protein